MEETLFIVSSKSGTTAEIKALTEHFFQRLSALRKEQAGDHFIAITDKGSPLEKLAKQRKFLRTFINFEEIGGRYSALSYFGMVPAALAGLPVKEILLRAKEMEKACGQDVPVKDNPAFVLGAALGEFAFQKCNKLTYLVPPGFSEFGLWLEQLVAESSGKEGKGILPVNGHPFSATGTFGKDRIFFRLSKQEEMQPFEQAEEPLATHHPMVNIHLKDPLDIGKEFLRWEIATATLGSVLGVNPFDQPNVEESKRHTIELLKKSGDDETFQGPGSVISEGPLYFYTAEPQDHAVALVLNFFVKQRPGDYLALLAYLPEKPEVDQCLIEMQQFLQNRSRITVTTQYGPRYLHSTGQLHKGGPAEGIFVQFTSSTDADIQVPECNYTFGSLKRAQAFGDRQALMSKGKKVLLVDLGKDTLKGLQAFRELLAHVPVSAKRHRKPIYSTDKNVKTRRTSMT